MIEPIGTIKLGEKILVADPCYSHNPEAFEKGYASELLVKPGDWAARIYTSVDDSKWERCFALLLEIGEYGLDIRDEKPITTSNISFELINPYLSVETGMMLVIDQAQCHLEESMTETVVDEFCDKVFQLIYDSKNDQYLNAALYPNGKQKYCGIVSKTGWGDGTYSLYVLKEQDKVVAMAILFF